MSITELATASQLGTSTISAIEKSRIAPSIQTLRILANLLQVPVSYLGCFETLPEETLSQKIHKARLFHGLTKREFANILGVDEHAVSKWEKEKRKPSQNSLEILKPFLDIFAP